VCVCVCVCTRVCMCVDVSERKRGVDERIIIFDEGKY
jgi:hypothetical protein